MYSYRPAEQPACPFCKGLLIAGFPVMRGRLPASAMGTMREHPIF